MSYFLYYEDAIYVVKSKVLYPGQFLVDPDKIWYKLDLSIFLFKNLGENAKIRVPFSPKNENFIRKKDFCQF